MDVTVGVFVREGEKEAVGVRRGEGEGDRVALKEGVGDAVPVGVGDRLGARQPQRLAGNPEPVSRPDQ